MTNKVIIYAGGPCTCGPGRRIRYVSPRGIEGLTPEISCRGVDSPQEDKRRHAIPEHAEYALRAPVLEQPHKARPNGVSLRRATVVACTST